MVYFCQKLPFKWGVFPLKALQLPPTTSFSL